MKVKISLSIYFLLQVFFIFPIKPKVLFKGSDIQKKLIELISNEKECIKVAMYAFTNEKVARKLVEARKRGVRVECIMDGLMLRNANTVSPYLRENNIPIKKWNSNCFGSYMHLKCWQFKSTKLNHESKYNPYVMTGSCNCTYNGIYRNVENAIILQGKQPFLKFDKNFKKLKTVTKYLPK